MTIAGTTEVRAFVPGDASRFALATDAGVFVTTDNGATYVERGDLADVRALAVSPSASSMLAVTGTDRLQRWDGVAGPWVDVAVPAPGGTFGQVLFLDDTTAVLGTSTGVHRTADGVTWTHGVVVPRRRGSGPRPGRVLLAARRRSRSWLRSSGLDAAAWTAYPGDGRGGGGRAGPWPCGPASS